jgi:hypothetical protein
MTRTVATQVILRRAVRRGGRRRRSTQRSKRLVARERMARMETATWRAKVADRWRGERAAREARGGEDVRVAGMGFCIIGNGAAKGEWGEEV